MRPSKQIRSPIRPRSVSTTGQPEVKDYQVNFSGDVVRGQFLTQVAGKDVWVTLAGHLGSNDGYATFAPTEFKVGDLNVPVYVEQYYPIIENRGVVPAADCSGEGLVESATARSMAWPIDRSRWVKLASMVTVDTGWAATVSLWVVFIVISYCNISCRFRVQTVSPSASRGAE